MNREPLTPTLSLSEGARESRIAPREFPCGFRVSMRETTYNVASISGNSLPGLTLSLAPLGGGEGIRRRSLFPTRYCFSRKNISRFVVELVIEKLAPVTPAGKITGLQMTGGLRFVVDSSAKFG